MATLSELQVKVKKALLPDTTAFGTTDITAYLNEGVNRIAAGIAIYDVLSPPLPELFIIKDVKTVALSGTGIAFVDSDPDTITDTGTGFVTAGFVAGMPITVSGAGEDDNNTTFHNIATVAAGTITLQSGDSLTAETAGESVTIRAPCVALPSDYNRGLAFVGSVSQGNRINIYTSHHKLLRKYPLLDDVGDVVFVAVKGAYLYYQGMPGAAEALTLHYYRKATAMSASDSEPDGIPSHLHDRLLVNYAAKEILGMIETAVKGKTLRSEKYEEKFQRAMEDFVAFIGPEDIEPIYYDDDQGYMDDYGYY